MKRFFLFVKFICFFGGYEFVIIFCILYYQKMTLINLLLTIPPLSLVMFLYLGLKDLC
jgi:hypothetical protein